MARRRTFRRGTVAVLVAICLVPILAIAALCLDGGLLLDQRRYAQDVADAAALAGADDLFAKWYSDAGADSNGSAVNSALKNAYDNNCKNDTNNSIVTAKVKPATGNFVGQPGYVEVNVTVFVKRCFSTFIPIPGADSRGIPVTARAVAAGKWVPSGAGILLLDPHASGAMTVTAGGVFTNARIMIDSDSSSAGKITAGIVTSPEVDVVGNVTGAGWPANVIPGSMAAPDPLAYLTQPNDSSIKSKLNVISNTKTSIYGGTTTLNPGIYGGGITALLGATVHLNPGIYYLQGNSTGGGFTFGLGTLVNVNTSGPTDPLTGKGVLIFNDPLDSTQTITNALGGLMNLTPPTTGIYQGITIFQRRDATAPVTVFGLAGMQLYGSLYAAKAAFNVQGIAASNLSGSQYIGYDLNVSGVAILNVTWDTSKVSRTRMVCLVE